MKVWERVIEARLRDRVEISKRQYEFMPEKGITRCYVCFKNVDGKVQGRSKRVHCVFVDLEKAYDRVSREELWYEKIRNSGKVCATCTGCG